MLKHKLVTMRKGKKILSTVLATAMIITSIPAMNFFKGALNVNAAVTYAPKKIGVSLLCSDMLSGNYGDNVYKALLRTNSLAEDSKNGSAFNNVNMLGLTYQNRHGDKGKSYRASLKDEKYSGLYDLAKKGQIQQSISANVKNHNHRSTKRHWNKIKQYCKVIFGYPLGSNNDWFSGKLFESNNNSDYSTIGGNDYWNTMNPDKGYKNQLAVYMTARKGCENCSGAYVENVSIALKDTKAPTISKITITSAQNTDTATKYFKAGQTIYAKVKFSEYVRLADNNDTSKQSTGIKLGLALGKKNTKEVTQIYADLISLKNDEAIFSYRVPATMKIDNENYKTDFFISGLADINNQKSFVVTSSANKNNKFDRVFLDNKGNTLSYSSGTMKKLESGVNDKTKVESNIKKTTCAITDIAGNPVDVSSFRVDSAYKKGVGIYRTYLDAVNPGIKNVIFSTNQKKDSNNDNANNYLKNGTKLHTKVVLDENIKTIASGDYSKIKAKLNVYNSNGSQITTTVKSISYGETTTIEFNQVTIDKNMSIRPISKGSEKSEYKITVTDIENKNMLKDYSDNSLTEIGDLRSNTGTEYFLDNESPVIRIGDEEIDSSKKYSMARCETEGEVYRVVFNTTDVDTQSGSNLFPFASGVIGGKGSISVDLKSSTVSDFQYILSLKEISNRDLSKKTFRNGKSNRELALDGTDERNTTFSLTGKTSYVYLYIKFIDNVDYSDMSSGLNIEMTSADVNENSITKITNFEYEPKDKINPTLAYEGITLKENSDNTAYQEAKVRIKDEGGIDTNNIKYIWVKEGNEVPSVESYKLLQAENVKNIKESNGKVIECVATINTENISQNQIYNAGLYVCASDITGNQTVSEKLVVANIDMTMPTLQVSVPGNISNKKSSLVVNGPFTSSNNDVSMFVVIEDPLNPENYFIRDNSGQASQIASKEEEYLDNKKLPFNSEFSDTEVNKWSYGKIEKSGSTYTITKEFNINQQSDKKYRDRFLAISGNMYYGKVRVLAGTGFKASAFSENGNIINFDSSKGSLISDEFTMMPDEYGLSKLKDVSANDFITYDGDTNKIDINPKDNYGKQVNKEDYINYNPEDNKAEYLSSLEGAGFDIKISNIRTKDFSTENINYSSKNSYIRLENVDGYIVYQWEVTEGVTTENIEIPEDLKLANGKYVLKVSLANYAEEGKTEMVSTAEYDNIFVYDYSDKMTEAFGINSVSTKINFTAKDEYENTERPPYEGFEKTGDYNFSRTLEDKRKNDYTLNTKDAYDTDTLYLGNCYTDTDDNKVISYDRTIELAVNEMTNEDLNDYWIKVWTGDSSNENKAKWFKFEEFNNNNNTMTITVKPIDAAKVKNIETAQEFYALDNSDEKCEIPVFEGSNTISYRIMNIGGNKSSVHEVEIMYHTKAPTLDIDVDKNTSVVEKMEARVVNMGSELVTKDVSLYETDFKGDESKVNPISQRTFEYIQNGRHLYYAIDGYGNLAYTQFYIENIDCRTPVASFKSISPAKFQSYEGADEDEGYLENAVLEVDVKDDKPLNNAQIEIAVDDKDAFTVNATDKWDYGDGYAGAYIGRTELEGTGINNIQVSYGPETDGGYYIYMYIQMNDDIDSSKSLREKINHRVIINVIDEVGHEMEKELTTDGEEFYGLNNVPKIKSVESEPEGEAIYVQFTGKVRVTKINGNDVPQELYGTMDMMDRFPITRGEGMEHYFEGADLKGIVLKDYFGICKDGTYDIEYVDVYNNKYTEKIEVKDFFGDYAANIEYSTLSKTNQNVVATITGVDKNSELTLKESQEKSDNYTVTWNKNKSKAIVEFSANDTVTFNLTVKGAAEEKTVEYNVSVGNIDKKAPDDVEVTWVFKETGDIIEGKELNTEELLSLSTNNDVEVYISSPTEEIYGINGKELKHTFKHSNRTERNYTFEYADECGNSGEPITVKLPDELILTDYETPIPEDGEQITDIEAPKVSAEIYAVYDGMSEYKTSWNPLSDTFEEISKDIGYTGGYQIKYTLFDVSKSKIVVLNGLNQSIDEISYNSMSQNISGVKVSEIDNSIVITEECGITVVAVDEAGNKVAHSFSATKFDKEKPKVTVKKVGKSFTQMRLQFYTDDNTDTKNQNGTILPITNGLKMGLDDEGYYYYMDVNNNGSYNTTFKDKSGNKTTVTTNVTEIDSDAPKIKVSSWSPCYTKDGKLYEKIAPTEPVRVSVTLALYFNKTVSEIKVYYKKDSSWILDDGSFSSTLIELGGRKAKVEFKEKVPGIVKVVATSPNGMSNELTDIDLQGIVDKEAPQVTVTKTSENNKVKFVCKSNEKVLVTGCDHDTTYGANTDIPLTVKSNGTYEISFTDMAGNITTKNVTVDSIDETPPSVYAVGIPEDYVSPQNCKVKVTMSEKGTITFQGKDYSVKAPVDSNNDGKLVGDELDWITLPISKNGSYQVKATDQAGLVSYKLLQVKYVDDQAPNIQFNKTVLNVSQGTTSKELEEELLDDSTFVLWDNIDKAPTVTVKNMLSEKQLNNQGIYEVEYVLTDSVGNKRTVNRYVKVISSANLKVRVNGELTQSCDTTILFDNNVDITLEKSKRSGESFKVYYKKGIRKAGSMKNAKVSKNGKLKDLDIGFYTLYVVTQNKESYLTYLFIGK